MLNKHGKLSKNPPSATKRALHSNSGAPRKLHTDVPAPSDPYFQAPLAGVLKVTVLSATLPEARYYTATISLGLQVRAECWRRRLAPTSGPVVAAVASCDGRTGARRHAIGASPREAPALERNTGHKPRRRS